MPPTFNHLDHSEEERSDAFGFWSRRFEAFAEGYYNHKSKPEPNDREANRAWKRLLELALETPTARIVHSHFPDFRDSEATFSEIVTFLSTRYEDQSSEYQSLNNMLDTFQRPGESFLDFLDRLGGQAARSGFPNAEAREFFTRHQALRGTSSQTIRANANSTNGPYQNSDPKQGEWRLPSLQVAQAGRE